MKISITMSRKTLSDMKACALSTRLFNDILNYANEVRILQNKPSSVELTIEDWTVVHQLWLCCYVPDFALVLLQNNFPSLPYYRLTLENLDLDSGFFQLAQFRSCNFAKVSACRADFRASVFDKLCTYQSQFNDSTFLEANFMQSNFRDCDFTRTVFNHTSIHSSRFTEAVFNRTQFLGSVVNHVVFNECKFNVLSISDANFRYCTFVNCQFNDVDFVGTDLTHVDFDHCTFDNTKFFDVRRGPLNSTVPNYRIEGSNLVKNVNT